MSLLPFLVTESLTSKNYRDGCPWDFQPDEQTLRILQATEKPKRRSLTLRPDFKWLCYTPVEGVVKSARVSKGNPPRNLRGIVCDYDTVIDKEEVEKFVGQMDEDLRPNFYEVSLSGKARLLWVFEKPVLTKDYEFCGEVMKQFIKKFHFDTLLPGFDGASFKPTEVWTYGGTVFDIKTEPLSNDIVAGVVMKTPCGEVARNPIPLDIIADEVEKRFPGRWQGPFEEDAQGVRFYDPAADCPTGCRVKPDGVQCFTGPKPFVFWDEIFGSEWCEKQRSTHLAKGAEGVYHDGREYWHLSPSGRWENVSQTNIDLLLAKRGLVSKIPKGETTSERDNVLWYIQTHHRIDGAAPLCHAEPGQIVDEGNQRILNISRLRPTVPAESITGDPSVDFPFLQKFMWGFLTPREGQKPLDHLLGWMQRFYWSILNHKKRLGQAVFVCGPVSNGKTLFGTRILAPLVGGFAPNPIDYLLGNSQFSDNLFGYPLLCVNDESGPKESQRAMYEQKLKALVVNSYQVWHPKFGKKTTLTWAGRIYTGLNDDPSSVSMLPSVDDSNRDKLSFYSSQPFDGIWPEGEDLENTIAEELPRFARWLLDVYKLPPELREDDRCGVRSYFDTEILSLSSQQVYAYNLKELIDTWASLDQGMVEKKEWVGTPTELFAALSGPDVLSHLMREWTVSKIAKSLIALAKNKQAGIEFWEGERSFKISRK